MTDRPEDTDRTLDPLAALLLRAVRAIAADDDETVALDDLARGTRDLLGADDVGVLLARPTPEGEVAGELEVVAATSSDQRLLELLQLQSDDGPCFEAYQEGVEVIGTAGHLDLWPAWGAAADERGVRGVVAAPLRYGATTIGAVNAVARRPDAFSASDLGALRAVADVATITLVSQRDVRSSRQLAAQLQGALESRVLIEQAKGLLAERWSVDPDTAFHRLRGHARETGRRLREVARAVVQEGYDPD